MAKKPIDKSLLEYWTTRVGDAVFTVQKRYKDLASVGSGAQGVVV